MPFLGDLERFAATTLYPWRFAIAALAIAVIAVLVILAVRRGWFAAARRHPGRTGMLVAAALVVLAPAAWYLGSPLFVRTELQETADRRRRADAGSGHAGADRGRGRTDDSSGREPTTGTHAD